MAGLSDPPLTGIRVLDLAEGVTAHAARLLGELGAAVTRIDEAAFNPHDLHDLAANRLKRRVTAAFDASNTVAALAEADLLIETTVPGSPAAGRLASALRSAGNARLAIVSVPAFGEDGPWRDWQATDPVVQAVTGGLSRSGLEGRAPLLPPGELALHAAAEQVAFLALTTLIATLRTGSRQHARLSMIEAAMAALDPGFGVSGSATSGVPHWKMARGRTDERYRYPILPCADGFVRLCVLAPRQWRGMWEWMGRSDAFAGREWGNIVTRYRSAELMEAWRAFLAPKTRLQVEREAKAHGVPAAAVLDVAEAVGTDHLRARDAFVTVEVDGVDLPLPNGAVEIDGTRAVPHAYAADDRFTARHPLPPADRPLAGVRVLDMGIIVVGAETGRLLADQGADVVKVENEAYPDGQRQTRDGAPISMTFAAGNRNKRGLSIDLRRDEGKALFSRLVAEADVLLSNFKPGTLAGLGFDTDTLARLNPRLIAIDSSAYGARGPWSDRLGYGPLVRASAGLTKQWAYPGDVGSFADAVTVYPDHAAARVGATAALALLLRRMRTGTGGRASVAQIEVMLGHQAVPIAALAAGNAGHDLPTGEREAPWGVFQAAGDDEWLVVTVRNDSDWRTFTGAIGQPELLDDPVLATPADRRAERERIDRITSECAATLSPHDAADRLQRAGVPAAAMLRVVDLPDTDHYRALGTFRSTTQPTIDDAFLVEGAPARGLPEPPSHPAPLIGEQSGEVLADWLALTPAEIADLAANHIIASPALAPPPEKAA